MYSSDSLDSAEFKESGHLARRFNYDLVVPSPTDSDKKWNTSLCIYWPQRKNERFEKLPEFKIKILTGQGEMDLSDNKEVKNQVFTVVAKIINLQNKSKDK